VAGREVVLVAESAAVPAERSTAIPTPVVALAVLLQEMQAATVVATLVPAIAATVSATPVLAIKETTRRSETLLAGIRRLRRLRLRRLRL
jgi:hypothetical protein